MGQEINDLRQQQNSCNDAEKQAELEHQLEPIEQQYQSVVGQYTAAHAADSFGDEANFAACVLATRLTFRVTAAMINAYLIDRAILLVDPLLFLSCLLLLWYTAPPLGIVRAYPFRVHLLPSLPFSDQWRKKVAPEHLRAIGRSRVAFFICLVMIAMAALLKFTYYEFFFVGLHALR